MPAQAQWWDHDAAACACPSNLALLLFAFTCSNLLKPTGVSGAAAGADEGVASANSPEAMFEHLCATLLQQSHLCPVRNVLHMHCPGYILLPAAPDHVHLSTVLKNPCHTCVQDAISSWRTCLSCLYIMGAKAPQTYDKPITVDKHGPLLPQVLKQRMHQKASSRHA